MSTVLDILRGRVGASSVPAGGGARVTPSRAVYAGRGRAALQLDGKAAGFDASAVAYRCVHTIAANLASIDLAVLRGDEPDEAHPIAQLWNRRPNPNMSARVYKETIYARAELTGEAFVYIDRGPTAVGEPSNMWPLYDPVEILADSGAGGQLRGFRVKVKGGNPVDLLPSEVLWLRYPHPFDQWGCLAPWKAALYATEADAYARAWQQGEFANGARPSHVVYLGDLEQSAHDAAVAEFRGNVEGAANAGKSLLVSGPEAASVARLGLTPAEMSYLESRVANAEEVMLAFGIPKDYLMGGATYENRAASRTTLWSDVLLEKLELLAGETDRQLLPDDTETAAFDVSGVEALRENVDSLWGRIGAAVYPDMLMLDEARAELGYDPLPNGDGQQTLTSYRTQQQLRATPLVRADGTAALPALPELVLPERRTVTGARAPMLSSRVRLYVGRGGLRAIAPKPTPAPALQTRAKGPLSRPRVEKFYDTHEAIGQKVVRRLADKQQRIVLRKLRDLGRDQAAADAWLQRHVETAEWPGTGARVSTSDWTRLPVLVRHNISDQVRMAADDLLDVPYWVQQSVELMGAWLAGVWDGGGAQVAQLLGVDFTLFDEQVTVAMQDRLDVLAAQVTETTRQVLDAQLLAAGVAGGESIPKLAARITSVFDDLSTHRAETIARTETVGGFNAASRRAAVASGVVLGRVWLATKDNRTRETHKGLDGQKVEGLDTRYSNGLLHPGDPSGPAKETINCRCVETFTV